MISETNINHKGSNSNNKKINTNNCIRGLINYPLSIPPLIINITPFPISLISFLTSSTKNNSTKRKKPSNSNKTINCLSNRNLSKFKTYSNNSKNLYSKMAYSKKLSINKNKPFNSKISNIQLKIFNLMIN